MNKPEEIVATESTLEEQCSRFSDILGLAQPVSEAVLTAALLNESYARNLLLSKDSPQMLEQLLKNPGKTGVGAKGFSNMELIGKAGVALARWAKTGFTMVNADILERRESACLHCPHLRAPKSLLQKHMLSSSLNEKVGHRTGKQVCDLCGCNVSNKIRLPSEACPDIDPDHLEQTRWGEPLADWQQGKNSRII